MKPAEIINNIGAFKEKSYTGMKANIVNLTNMNFQ